MNCHEPSFAPPPNHLLHLGPQLDKDSNPLPTHKQLIFGGESDAISPGKLSAGNTRKAEVDTSVCSPTLPKPESSTLGGGPVTGSATKLSEELLR